jgi:chorismate synthase
MSSDFGKNIRYTVFGQSHSEAIGIVIDGLPAGETVDPYEIRQFMTRRAPAGKAYATKRTETDDFQIISGVLNDKTCGAPLCAIIMNQDVQSKSYEEIKDLLRPSHADYTAHIKYNGFEDYRGGGHFSGRLTAPLCFAGGLSKYILEKRGIVVGAHILTLGNVQDKPFDPVHVSADDLKDPGRYPFPTYNVGVGETMQAQIGLIAKKNDSIGGIIEAGVVGLPSGLGDPMFDGMENLLAKHLFGIPAVKGVEFGDGFATASLRGSENNDDFCLENGGIKTKTNHAGGILGGITTGMPLILRVAVKPTPSIMQKQNTVNIATEEETTITIEGRHDPCIVPRAVPVVESVIAMTILDLLTGAKG